MASGTNPILTEQEFTAAIPIVWAAITEVEQMRQWFFDNIPAFEPTVGFETKFTISSEKHSFSHQWKITEVIPYQKITYHWSYKEYSGEAFVHFELFEIDKKTLLRVTNVGLETFPQHILEFSTESCKAGWDYFIQLRLHDFLKDKDFAN